MSEETITLMTVDELRKVQEFLRPIMSEADFEKASRLLAQKYIFSRDIQRRADQLLRMFERKRRPLHLGDDR